MLLPLLWSPPAKANAASDEALLRTVGEQLYIRKKWPGAEVVFRKLIELCPQDYFARQKLVKALLADGKAAEAVSVAKQLVVMQPAEPESHNLLGKCEDRVVNYKEALQNYKKAHILCSANLNYVLAMASDYRKIGRVFRCC